ncbi:ParB/RepB/Spo0J family partition protein [Arthrobacter woluwensis]|uniref:ParB/RepB/Spo0J family partition protein n=1 Tax=Arthrobacter woluwensis TaxID=156980 RepID=UPI0011A197F1|nr:ParB/RepB/Spo0J family partition protein [Arthrobacter woluwensis]
MTPTLVRELPLALIDPHPKNIRRDVGNVVDLSKSITAKGLLQPLVVAPVLAEDGAVADAEHDSYVLIAGHRRRAACVLAGVEEVPCIIRTDLDTEAKQLEAMLVENTQRADLTVLEEASAIQGLLDLPGFNADKIAKSIGRSRSYVRDRAKLTGLIPSAAAQLEGHQLTLEKALMLAEFEGDEYAQSYLLNTPEYYGDKQWEVRAEDMRRRRASQAKIPQTVQRLAAQGAKVREGVASWSELNSEGKTFADVSHGPSWLVHALRETYGDWSDEQHIAAGHEASVTESSGGEARWIVPMPEYEEPEPSEEEIARAEAEERIQAGLEVVGHVRMKHLHDTFTAGPPAAALSQIRNELASRISANWMPEHYQNAAWVESANNALAELAFGRSLGSMSKTLLRQSLDKLSFEQLVVLDYIRAQRGAGSSEVRLSREVEAWDTAEVLDWRDDLEKVWGWTFTDIEREAITFHDPAEDDTEEETAGE